MNKKQYERSALDKKLDKKTGYREGSKKDEAMDRKVLKRLNNRKVGALKRKLKMKKGDFKAGDMLRRRNEMVSEHLSQSLGKGKKKTAMMGGV